MLLIAQVIGGLVLLYLGGEWLVRGAVSMANRLGVSPLIVGLSVVAAGTSAPELFVSLISALDNRPGIAIGNVVGSNIANILLVLGAAALVWPILVRRSVVTRDGVVLIGATFIFCLLAVNGHISRIFGIAMVLIVILYLYISYRHDLGDVKARKEIEGEVAELDGERPVWLITAYLLAGFAGVLIGSELLVSGAVGVATKAGVSETVIGVTLVAIGTSLPELAASIAAAKNRHTDLALGNVLGSCIFNILAIIGIVSSVIPLRVPAEVLVFDLWAMLGVTLAFIGIAFFVPRLGRVFGIVMLLAYAAYIGAQFTGLSAIPLMGHTG